MNECDFFYEEKNGLKLLKTRLIPIAHCFTTRVGGVSQGDQISLNLALHVGDRDEDVIANREKISESFGWSLADWAAGEQVHGCHIEVVCSGGRGSRVYSDSYPATDGLVTNVPGVVLSTYAADCIPILIYDPVKKAIGVAHGGWKGTVNSIAKEAVETMTKEYGTDPADCLAAIGPGIGPECFEVDYKVKDIWQEKFDFYQEVVKIKGEKYLIDLWETNRRVLIGAGLKEENIAVAEISTMLNTDLYYSYRKEAGKTGRHAGLICLS